MSHADLDRLLDITSIPTAAGHEDRVIASVERFVARRDALRLTRDAAGNLVIARADAPSDTPPLYITAHLDHPAFVVERVVSPTVVEATFRGGVRDPYFRDARVALHPEPGERAVATILEAPQHKPFRTALLELDAEDQRVGPGVVGTWDLPDASIEDGLVHAPACDDLAALSAALDAVDALLDDEAGARVRLLFTRAEEIGFVGAIAACAEGTMEPGSRVIALENSRSFAESPIGAGPIVRVGDRMSTFSPSLTAAVARRAQDLAEETRGGERPFRFQRRLMPGGACEASAFHAWGYEATCVCLPLGNYHNMGELDRVEREIAERGEDAPIDAPIGREYISVDDYRWLVDLLVACARRLEHAGSIKERLEKLYHERAFVLHPREAPR